MILLPGKQSTEYRLAVRVQWGAAVLAFVGLLFVEWGAYAASWHATAGGIGVTAVAAYAAARVHGAYSASRGHAKASAHAPRPQSPNRGI